MVHGILEHASIEPTAFARLDEPAAVPHPFPYQGSKRALAHAILPLIPGDATRIIEPFCGSAAVSIAAMYSGRVASALLGDINAPLIDLWQSILREPENLADEYQRMWTEQAGDPRSYFWSVREAFNRSPKPAQLLYLLNRIVKDAVRYGRDGAFNQSPDHRRLGAKPHLVRDRVIRVSRVLTGSDAVTCGFEELTNEATRADVIYMDPPYQGTTNVRDDRYMQGLPKSIFEAALDRMNQRGLSYIVSYDVVRDDAKYGEALSPDLGLTHMHLLAGRSSQSTLLGRSDLTVESLYLSPGLVERLGSDGHGFMGSCRESVPGELLQPSLL